jgi:hypothetical protein
MAHDALNEGLLKAARACGKSSHRLWAVDDARRELGRADPASAGRRNCSCFVGRVALMPMASVMRERRSRHRQRDG